MTPPTPPASNRTINRTPSAALADTEAESFVPYTCYKLHRSTVEMLEKEALRRGWSGSQLVRTVLREWAVKARAAARRRG